MVDTPERIMKRSNVSIARTTVTVSTARIAPNAKPSHILFTATDPFDDQELCSSLLTYDRRRSAAGFYIQYAKRMVTAAKVGAPQIIEGREPLITTELLYA